MKRSSLFNALLASGVISLSVGGMAIAAPCRANPCAPRSSRMNPCAAKNPCAARNPCAAKNPCAASSPDYIKPEIVTRPANYRPYQGKHASLVKYGKKLFSDTSLSTNGLSCNSCHQGYGAFQDTFAKSYPHFVQMTFDRSKVKSVNLDEMVQFCMVAPMASQPLAWNGKKLAALTAYTAEYQKGFKVGQNAGAANPCAAKNPCSAKKMNPCAAKMMNPCAAKNPCGAKMNPCAMKNPCGAKNPCAAKHM